MDSLAQPDSPAFFLISDQRESTDPMEGKAPASCSGLHGRELRRRRWRRRGGRREVTLGVERAEGGSVEDAGAVEILENWVYFLSLSLSLFFFFFFFWLVIVYGHNQTK